MKTISEIMSNQSKREYLENCRARYPSRNRLGKSRMIDDVCDTMGWNRKHTIKALNGQVSLGKNPLGRWLGLVYGEDEKTVIVEIWKHSEQPCGKRLRPTIPLWLASYEARHGALEMTCREKILKCSARQLDRITKPHRVNGQKRYGRCTGRTSHRLKTLVPVQCGPQETDRPGYMEVDTVSHGGGSASGQFMWSLTMTDIHSGWTELYGLWGGSGSELCVGASKIEARIPFELLGFDCDNGSEFLNSVMENYLLNRKKKVKWTRSRPYKKNDQAHVEQKNFTHVRQLLGYGRYSDIRLVELVNDLYENAWLPMRNYYTPVMKLIEKTRVGSKVKKRYDEPQTPCDRLLACINVDEETKQRLTNERAKLDPLELAENIEMKLEGIYKIINEIEAQRAEEEEWMKESEIPAPTESSALAGGTPPRLAIARRGSEPPARAENLAKTEQKEEKQTVSRVS